MPLVVFLFVFILLELRVELIDGIVSQVHVKVVKVRVNRTLVLLSRKTSKPHVVNKYAQRIHSVEQHVYPQVELQVVYQVRLVDVSLYYAPLRHAVVHDLLNAARQKYSLPL